MTAADFEVVIVHRVQNEISKTKLNFNLSPAAGINLVVSESLIVFKQSDICSRFIVSSKSRVSYNPRCLRSLFIFFAYWRQLSNTCNCIYFAYKNTKIPTLLVRFPALQILLYIPMKLLQSLGMQPRVEYAVAKPGVTFVEGVVCNAGSLWR